jgi:ribose transport system permease protein
MSIDVPNRVAGDGPARGHGLRAWLLKVFLRVGVLPFLLVAAVLVFSMLSDQFLTAQNLTNLIRQSVYLILVSMGQMLALATGGFDLSVGTIVALTSVVSASVMSTMGADGGSAAWAVLLGCGAGLAAGSAVGLVNGLGIALGNVSPFIMTLGVQSIGLGIALALTGGVPVSGIPGAFGDLFGFGTLLGIPIPVVVTAVIVVAMYVLMTRTATGTHLLAVGGNAKAAALSGISTRRTLLLAYVLCSLLAAVSGLLLTARVNSGEANLGGTIALESIAACVIAGVSLRGGIARVESVVLGAIFIGLVQNGMNLTNVGSYMQMVVLGLLLILAVVADSLRHQLISQGR